MTTFVPLGVERYMDLEPFISLVREAMFNSSKMASQCVMYS